MTVRITVNYNDQYISSGVKIYTNDNIKHKDTLYDIIQTYSLNL